LNRLTYASTTQASSTPYKHTFAYDPLGSITQMSTSSVTTTYTYAGTGYANPHAATSVGGYTLAYDNNGNLTSYGVNTYSWDYRNRMTQTGNAIATSSYGYDYQNNRVSQTAGGITTIYVNKLYSTNNASTTKHIFAGNDLIAVVERTTATTTHIIHIDHLGGTNAITDADGDIVQALDYYPYGGLRIDSKTGSFSEGRKYIGQYYDEDTALSYLNARYYDGARGQFTSQDPTHLAIGDQNRLQQITGQALQQVLSDPQQLNSYAYARNNPIRFSDPEGEFVPQAVVLGGVFGGVAGAAFQAYADYQAGSLSSFSTYANATARGALIGVTTAINPFLGGGTASTLSLRESYVNNGGHITTGDAVSALAEGAVTTLTAGYLKGVPQVRGVQATNITGGTYWAGAHAQRYAQEAVFGLGTDVYYNNVRNITNNALTNNGSQFSAQNAPRTSQNYSAGSSGGGSYGSLVQQLQSLVSSLKSLVSSLSKK
ncbi:MAG TPA: RHS repeat-associated core domain-containing protein, partial [Candidatus Andersenbacteria bacterium]|nr:RHS repeat-associated core domain-containing protein [Candidatus Andersenbacteria bacterium]